MLVQTEYHIGDHWLLTTPYLAQLGLIILLTVDLFNECASKKLVMGIGTSHETLETQRILPDLHP